jgi:hypothetical protein
VSGDYTLFSLLLLPLCILVCATHSCIQQFIHLAYSQLFITLQNLHTYCLNWWDCNFEFSPFASFWGRKTEFVAYFAVIMLLIFAAEFWFFKVLYFYTKMHKNLEILANTIRHISIISQKFKHCYVDYHTKITNYNFYLFKPASFKQFCWARLELINLDLLAKIDCFSWFQSSPFFMIGANFVSPVNTMLKNSHS